MRKDQIHGMLSTILEKLRIILLACKLLPMKGALIPQLRWVLNLYS